MSRVVVNCTKCSTLVDYDPPNGFYPYGVWRWHQPRKHCGANECATYDTDRDIQTGQLVKPAAE